MHLRQRGLDVVVCGTIEADNWVIARRIEHAVHSRAIHHAPHAKAGPRALPHFQPRTRPPDGHTFYEGMMGRAA